MSPPASPSTSDASPDLAMTMSAPFGQLKDSAFSSRYHYENDQRGNDSFVIIQRTTTGRGICRWQERDLSVPPETAFICLVPDPVEAVIHICRTRFREHLGIKEIADQAGLSREHLTRIFTARMGTSPARYLRNHRVDAAREMRRFSDATWTETALRCGFPSVKALRSALSD
jgi:AraC-like DNA-binding protein